MSQELNGISDLVLTEQTVKYVSVGNNVYLNSKGTTETCRKGQRGEYCKRHQSGSVNLQVFKNMRTLDQHMARTQEKLSPFENGFIWLYSILTKMPIEQAKEHYASSTAMYTFLGVKDPNESEVTGLQKVLLKLINTQNDTSKLTKLRNMVKNMTLGQGFTVAGFNAMRDLVRETLTKIRIGIAGLGLAGTLTLTGCAGATPTPQASTSQAPTDSDNGLGTSTEDGRDVAGTQATNLSVTTIGSFKDNNGSYTRSSFASPDVSIVKNGGVPATDLKSSLDFYSNFVSTEVMDSIALDNPSQWEEWKKTVAPKYLSSKYMSDILNTGNDGVSADIIMTNRATSGTTNMYMPNLMRDGKARIFNKQMGNIEVQPIDGGVYIIANVTGILIIDDKNTIDYLDVFSGKGANEGIAIYEDGKPQTAKIMGSVGLTLLRDGSSWKIAGFNNSYTLNNVDMGSNITPDILALRK